MIDNDILISEMERLMICVTKLEFSVYQSDKVVEAARKAREALDNLVREL